MRGKELEKFMEDLAREDLKTYKKYDFNEVSKMLEDEVRFTHQFAFNDNVKKK